MELKERKRINNSLERKRMINNSLPKFDGGTDYWSGIGSPIGDGWNKWSQSPSESVLSNSGYGQPALSVPPQLPGNYWLGGTSTDPMAIIQPRMEQLMNPNSQWNQNRIKDINTPITKSKPNNSAAGLKAASVIGGVANLAGGFIGQNAVKSSDELLANAGLSQGNVMGISYQRQNDINADEEMSAVTKSGISNTISSVATGASAGAAFGPIGAAVGGVVGGITGLIGLGTSKHKLRKRIENARITAQRRNTYNMSTAMSAGLQQDYYTNNASGGLLYANNGKDVL